MTTYAVRAAGIGLALMLTATACGDDADAERGLAFLARDEGRRVDEAVGNGRDIAEPEHAAVAFDGALLTVGSDDAIDLAEGPADARLRAR